CAPDNSGLFAYW
nr:immunoglobulin heavy chain junction region [Mus musculus]